MSDDDDNAGGPRQADAFDQADGYSGQDYHREREQALGAPETEPDAADQGGDLPPDNGRRAGADPVTGEVHGSGSGIGGGNPGEDLGSASPSGDLYPVTGGEGTDHRPGSLGPPPPRH